LNRLADGQEAAEPIPVTAELSAAEDAPGATPAKIEHLLDTIRLNPKGAEGDHWKLPLGFRVDLPEHQQFLRRRRTHSIRVKVGKRRLSTDLLVQVDELKSDLYLTIAVDRKGSRVYVGINMIVVTGLHQVVGGIPVVNGSGNNSW